jgi:hypothetical protein
MVLIAAFFIVLDALDFVLPVLSPIAQEAGQQQAPKALAAPHLAAS